MNQPYEGGTSDDIVAGYVRDQIRAIGPKSVVDFGAGRGKMGMLCRDLAGSDVELTAVEGCPQTVALLERVNIYNNVKEGLLQDWIDDNTQQYDLAIFGDVLEHLTRKQSLHALSTMLQYASNIIVNIPLRNLHQDGHDDNPLEAHLAYFTEHCFDRRFIVREKHVASPSLGYTKMNIWITGKKQFRIKNAIKGQLLRHFGRPAKVMLEKLGYDSFVSG